MLPVREESVSTKDSVSVEDCVSDTLFERREMTTKERHYTGSPKPLPLDLPQFFSFVLFRKKSTRVGKKEKIRFVSLGGIRAYLPECVS